VNTHCKFHQIAQAVHCDKSSLSLCR